MVSFISDYLRDKIGNHIFRAEPMISPDNVYIALYDDKKHELLGSGYLREEITLSTPIKGAMTNLEEIMFYYASKQWKEIVYLGILDHKEGGKKLFFGPLREPIIIKKHHNFAIKKEKLVVGFK